MLTSNLRKPEERELTTLTDQALTYQRIGEFVVLYQWLETVSEKWGGLFSILVVNIGLILGSAV